MLIQSYSFGQMWIDGCKHEADLLLLPDGRIIPDWRRRIGHSLLPEDLQAIIASAPDRLIIGCGAHGMLTIPKSTTAYLLERGIRLYTANTAKAVRRWNEWTRQPDQRLAAGFHLTC